MQNVNACSARLMGSMLGQGQLFARLPNLPQPQFDPQVFGAPLSRDGLEDDKAVHGWKSITQLSHQFF